MSASVQTLEKPLSPDRGLAQLAGYRMKRCFDEIKLDLTRTLEPLGLRMVTFSVLVVIRDNPEIRPSELSQILSIERPNLVTLIGELEKAGWLNRSVDERDRRAFCLSLTPMGEKKCREAQRVVQAHEESVLAALTNKEQSQLIVLLKKVQAGLSYAPSAS